MSSSPLLTLLKQCSTPRHLEQLHAYMLPRALDVDHRHLPNFIRSCSHFNLHSYAFSLFKHTPHPDLFLVNTTITCLAQTHLAGKSLLLFRQIPYLGFQPDAYSYPAVLKAIAHLGLLQLGCQTHAQTIRVGLGTDAYVGTGLLRMYSSCGDPRSARKLFDDMSLKSVLLWNAMMAAYAEAGDLVNVLGLFDRMTNRNLVSWTTVISVLARHKRSNEAVRFFLRMREEDGIEPDEVTLLAALSACADLGALELGRWIHWYMDCFCVRKTTPLLNTLVLMYSKSGDIKMALDVFENMAQRSIVSFTTVIEGLALHGLGVEAIQMFCRMEEEQIQPNEVSFLAILSACSHSGLVDAGLWCFDVMTSRYGMEPRIEHYGCMVDLLGRAGMLQEARELMEGMPYKPNATIFGSLLSAARLHGDSELGMYALRHLVEVEPHNSGNYSLLCNLYASKGNWKDAGSVRKLMREGGIYKVPGGSIIELNGEIHEFMARDSSHLLSDRIYEVLHEIDGQLKMLRHA